MAPVPSDRFAFLEARARALSFVEPSVEQAVELYPGEPFGEPDELLGRPRAVRASDRPPTQHAKERLAPNVISKRL
jgi:hypothetical protein